METIIKTSEHSTLLKSKIIDGKQIANTILDEIKLEINKYKDKYSKPLLTIIQIGNNQDSNIYIKKKVEACNYIGFDISIYHFDTNVKQNKIYKLIDDLNTNDKVNGILVQLPIPTHLNEEELLSLIDYRKDVDGFHALNMGNLALDKRTPMFVPCTPLGCMELFKRENIELLGKNVVIIGKSNIVGLPMALLLLKEMATVTVCHVETINIQNHLINADIVISACGQPQLIKREWLKSGVIVIDVGINAISDISKKSGYRLVGDVDFDNVKEIANKITPVPGGVGPMTVAMLMFNVLKSFKNSKNIL